MTEVVVFLAAAGNVQDKAALAADLRKQIDDQQADWRAANKVARIVSAETRMTGNEYGVCVSLTVVFES